MEREYIAPKVDLIELVGEGSFASSWDGCGINDIPHNNWDSF